MIENLVRASTCQIDCGKELGTGFLVSDHLVLTARHCVVEAIMNEAVVNITFPELDLCLVAEIVSVSEEFDICLLSISEEIDIAPIQFDDIPPQEGSNWYAFGFPEIKRSFGHRVAGHIAQVLSEPKLKMNLDLSVEQSSSISSYVGLSGSALISDGVCKGLIRLKIDKSLCAISVTQITEFLEESEIQVRSDRSESTESLVEREEFKLQFEKKIKCSNGEYLFLSGSNGIGKSTFCTHFQPTETSMLMLGSYSLSLSGGVLGAAHRVQSSVFFDWLSTTISMQLTGKPARKEVKSYTALIEGTSMLLNEFASYCLTQNRQGVLFVDGLNEAQGVSEGLFSQFIGLFPSTLPSGITVVFTAPNFENIASHLEGRVNSESQIQLPGLEREVVRSYCWKELREDRATVSIIRHICKKAQGHPLYLRYLIEFANNCSEIDELEDFPQFSGAVAEYYEQLWLKLLHDQEAVNLLAIISRLRFGISTELLPKILSAPECSVLVPTLSRIRHLLASSHETTIYHLSFAEFLTEKTIQLQEGVERRLAEFCIHNADIEYCVLNSVFHSLRSGDHGCIQAIHICNQSWVDQCVTIGVKPDTLLFDIENVLAACTECGSTVDIVRILLLSHRTNFRYNTLFAQSASLIAEALIALGKPQEALQHTIRFNTLIINPEEAFRIVFFLLDKEYKVEAKELLILVDDNLEDLLTSQRHSISEYIILCQYRLRTLLFLDFIGENDRSYQPLNFLIRVVKTIRANTEDLSDDVLLQISAELQSILTSFYLCFQNRYSGVTAVKESGLKLPGNMLELLVSTLEHCLDSVNSYHKIKKSNFLPEIFLDIKEIISSGLYLSDQTPSEAVDTLIKIGAPVSLIQSMAEKENSPTQIKILSENGVDLDYKQIYQGESSWRITAFLSDDIDCPQICVRGNTDWLHSLELIFSALCWCEGKARLGKAENDESLLNIALECLQSQVLSPLSFSLKERVLWENSYSIPEQFLPLIYRKLSELYLDCFAENLSSFLDHIAKHFNTQFGIYSEGFRSVLFSVVDEFTSEQPSSSLSDEIFKILNQWKSFVVENIDNRHELVPELLKLIPLFIKVDAKEIAEELYQHTLNVSMGPNWYKEDQFRLMVSLLSNTDNLKYEQGISSEIAGYLERASGDMTFQRFVRYEKTAFIGELIRHKKYSQAINYYKRQTCGALPELLYEATNGNIDRVDSLSGMRYPGGALDEQDAISKIVHNAKGADWRLCWGLLEIYLFGDERYLDRYAVEFAKLINLSGVESGAIPEMVSRMEFVLHSELSSNQHVDFLSHFKNALDKTLYREFSVILNLLPAEESGEPLIEKSEIDSGTQSIEEDELLFMPGTFGRSSATKESNQLLAIAESKIERGNLKDARNQAVSALQVLQRGGWSIWGNLSTDANRMMDIIQNEKLTADEISQLYAPLLLEERYQPRWSLAEHLITKCANRLNQQDSFSLAQCVMEHIGLMLGDAKNEIESFKFLDDVEQSDISTELLGFIIWLVEHPQWLRKEKAANVLAWLLDKDLSYYKYFITEAFSMRIGFGPDVICGILDGMSLIKPLETWEQIESHLDIDLITQKCSHISRLAVLQRIADRAASKGSVSASSIVTKIIDVVCVKEPSIQTNNDKSIPNWAACVQGDWQTLDLMGYINDEIVAHFKEEMIKVCSPLDVETAWKLEEVVSLGFRVSKNEKLNRWEAKVRFALNVALYRENGMQNSLAIEPVLRVFNPSTLWLTFGSGKESRADIIIDVLSNKCDPKNVISKGDSILLNYQEMIDREDLKKPLQIEITAILTSSYSGYQSIPPNDNSLFCSKDYPDVDKSVSGNETCHRVDPKFTFLGTFTPAIPTKSFVKLISAQEGNFIRSNWKDGRSCHSQGLGRPNAEGCLLAIKRSRLHLPADYKLAWVFKVNGKITSILNGMDF